MLNIIQLRCVVFDMFTCRVFTIQETWPEFYFISQGKIKSDTVVEETRNQAVLVALNLLRFRALACIFPTVAMTPYRRAQYYRQKSVLCVTIMVCCNILFFTLLCRLMLRSGSLISHFLGQAAAWDTPRTRPPTGMAPSLLVERMKTGQ